MISNLRRDGQGVVVVVVEKEEFNERSEEQGRDRDSETGATRPVNLKKTGLVLVRHGMVVYEEGGEERLTVRDSERRNLERRGDSLIQKANRAGSTGLLLIRSDNAGQ